MIHYRNGANNQYRDVSFDFTNLTPLLQKLELKNWVGFWGDSIKKQFVYDLGNMDKLGDVKWIFSKKGVNQSIDELRANVIKNLKKADGSPIDGLNELFNEIGKIKKMQEMFGESVINPTELLKRLDEPGIFKQIFEIVE